jgi:hypothetical protein
MSVKRNVRVIAPACPTETVSRAKAERTRERGWKPAGRDVAKHQSRHPI